MKNLIIVGGGFAGFWAAVSAARCAGELDRQPELAITLISKDAYLTNRPGLYLSDLSALRIPIEPYCQALGITLVIGEVGAIDPAHRRVSLTGSVAASQDGSFVYDRLILAAGSRVATAAIPGMALAFDVDTYTGAEKLNRHLAALAESGFESESSRHVAVAGAGLTGLEVATGMPARLGELAADVQFKVHLIETAPGIGGYEDDTAKEYITRRLDTLGVQCHLGSAVASIETHGATLNSGEFIPADTVIWTAGMQAHPLTASFGCELDAQGRLEVDSYLNLREMAEVFAAGDVCKALVDDSHYALMSCQHAMPQGRFAGHNAVSAMFGGDMIPYAQPRYVTCVDLGPDDALFTTGWQRRLEKTGPEAKSLKNAILTDRVVPPTGIEDTLRMSHPLPQ